MNSIEEIKTYILQNIQLEKVVGEFVSLEKQSGKLTACCPFHEEKTPSFFIFDHHYHCFGCKAHGDVISFVRERQGLGFIESLKWLCDKFGIQSDSLYRSSNERTEWKKAISYNRIFSMSQDYFAANLQKDIGAHARIYLEKRGFSKEQIEEFHFGYAHSATSSLMHFLKSQGISDEKIAACSLGNNYDGKEYDFFRNRITIPIRDSFGRIIAFGGRTLADSDNIQKYKNSRYDKSSVLFGLHEARDEIRKQARAIVVEGYLDAIKLWSCGLREVVACQGTSLSKQHLSLLKNQTSKIYLLFDGDKAGRQAILRVFRETLEFSGLSFNAVVLPDGEDPDSFVTEHGAECLQQLLEESKSLLEYAVLQRMQKTADQDVPQVIREEFIPWLSHLKDPIKKAYLIDKISLYSGVSKDLLEREFGAEVQNKKNTVAAPSTLEEYLEPPQHTKDLAGHLYYADPTEVDYKTIREFCQNNLSLSAEWSLFFEETLNHIEQGNVPHTQPFLSFCSEENEKKSSSYQFFLKIQKTPDAFSCKNRSKIITKLLLLHKKEHLQQAINSLKNQVLALRLHTENDRLLWQKIVGQIQLFHQEMDDLDTHIKS